jgi:hypothetical protein
VHDPLQHSLKVVHAAPAGRQQTDAPSQTTPLHVAPESAQQLATPQSCPAFPQHVPPTHR